MMKSFRLIIFLLAVSQVLLAQSTVRVPSHMDFAGVKLKITDKGRKAIQEEVDRITQSPKYFNAKVDKANIYFPIIERAFREEGVSTDFKYLTLQESALIADAVSTSNAVGYWQFKDFTAIEMGLRVDRHVDERMNIYASSRAAARYMKKNNTYFDNWIFALQAYQMGAGAAMEAIDSKLYGSKSVTITDKTYWYVRTFLAHKIAYEQAVGKSAALLNLVVYTSGQGKSLHDIAREMSLAVEEVESHNIWLKKGKIPDDKSYAVILPATKLSRLEMAKADKMEEAPKQVIKKAVDYDIAQAAKFPTIEEGGWLLLHSEAKRINGISGIIAKEGESIRDLAKRGGVELSKFLKYNDMEIDHWIKPGQVFYLKKKRTKAKVYYHVVQNEEDLWMVSQKYGVRLNKLLTKNRMKTMTDVKPGRVLWMRHIRPANVAVEYKNLPKPEEPIIVEIPMPARGKEIQGGDGMETPKPQLKDDEIDSLKNHQPVDSLGLVEEKPDSLSAAEVEEMNSMTDAGDDEELTMVKHVVKAGETLYRISKIYNVEVMNIVEWNKLNLTQDIKAGQELVVFTAASKAVAEDEPTDKGNFDDGEIKHVVKTGDTLYSLSKEYNVPVDSLMKWNNKTDHSLKIEEILLIWKKKKE